MLTKLPMIFSTPRSGSTWLYCLIRDRLAFEARRRGTPEVRGLDEFLHPVVTDATTGTDGSLLVRSRQGEIEIPLSAATRWKLALERLASLDEALDRSPTRYFFKVFAGALPRPLIPGLRARYDWIFLERRDRWEQYLSYLLAKAANRWTEVGDGVPEAGSVTPRREDVESFRDFMYDSHLCLGGCSPPPERVLVYEECLHRGLRWTLARIGLPLSAEEMKTFRPELPMPLVPVDKLSRFVDPAQVVAWYREARLPPAWMPRELCAPPSC